VIGDWLIGAMYSSNKKSRINRVLFINFFGEHIELITN